jgi:phosphotriesterase-related protein
MVIQTTSGAISPGDAGLILPHEHIFTDLRGPETAGYGQADVEDVVRIMKPHLDAAKSAGVGILVECSSIGVGRNVPILQRMTAETGLAIMVPTGVYSRAGFVPSSYASMSEGQLRDWMVRELTSGIDNTGVRAGFIKLAVDNTPMSAFQQTMMRAAAQASLQTGAAIATHTGSGARALEETAILESEGLSLNRFIWVHAQSEADMNIHQQLAAKGAYIEFDSIGNASDATIIAKINTMVAAGYEDNILLSHDAGWYQPGSLNGGTQRGFTYLTETFIPALRADGASQALIDKLTIENPANAFAMPEPPAGSASDWPTYD